LYKALTIKFFLLKLLSFIEENNFSIKKPHGWELISFPGSVDAA